MKSLLSMLLVVLFALPGLARESVGPSLSDIQRKRRKGEVIVELRPGVSIEAVNERHQTTTIRRVYGTNFYRLRTPSGRKEKRWRKRLEKDPDVLSATFNAVVSNPGLFARATASFPEGFAKPGKSFADFRAQESLFDLLQLEAVNLRSRGAGTVVAVIDTGVDFHHPALHGRLWRDEREGGEVPGDGIDNDGDGLIDDAHGWDFVDHDASPVEAPGDPETTVAGHGTFIAGLITMLAPDCRIMPLRAFPPDGLTDAFTVAEAVKYAADHGADVINLSLGSPEASPLLEAAILEARERGITVVAAVGNDNDEFTPQFPSRLGDVLAVGAISLDGLKAAFSNYGEHLDVCAPGSHLVSAYPGQRTYSLLAGSYAEWSGTSFAAPLAAAEAALLLSAEPNHRDVRELIKKTAISLDEMNPMYAGKLGAGRINPLGALQKLNTDAKLMPSSDQRAALHLRRIAAGGMTSGRASIAVTETGEEFRFLAQNLNPRSDYLLFINGQRVARGTANSLGSLRFRFASNSKKNPLNGALDPVSQILHVELRDVAGRRVLAGDFSPDAVSEAPQVAERRVRLDRATTRTQAAGRATVRVETADFAYTYESVVIEAEGLQTGQQYQFLINGVPVKTITAQSGFARLRLSTDAAGEWHMPAALGHARNIQYVEIRDAGGMSVLHGAFPNRFPTPSETRRQLRIQRLR